MIASVEEIDMMEWISRTSLENLGQGVLGYSFGALDENSADDYDDAIKMLKYAFDICFGVRL